MINYRRREKTAAVFLTGLAGYVDALGFLKLGGFFISFMSGNSTQLGVGIGRGPSPVVLPAALIGLFVAGVVLGSLLGHVARSWRRVAVLAFIASLLCTAALCDARGMAVVAIAAMALAMGAENTVFERDGEVSIGLTYMTGTLVKLGQNVTTALLGGERWGWSWHLLLWLGLVLGTVIGARVYVWAGLQGLWLAAGLAAALSLAMIWLTPGVRTGAPAPQGPRA